LKSLAQKIEKFVEGEGDLDGALFDEWVAWSNRAIFIAD
jgi:hypothetical protein